MVAKPLESYADVQKLLDDFVTNNSITIPRGHKRFWDTLTYEQFRDGNVPGVADPDTGDPIKVLVVGKPEESNLILSLRGIGPLFDPNTGSIGQMPLGFAPMPDDQIDALADWIKRGCPNGQHA